MSDSSRIRKLLKLSSREWSALITSLCLLPLTGLMIRFYGVQRIQARLTPEPTLPGGRDTADELAESYAMARVVNIAAYRGFYRANCLTRSLVLFHLLRRRGLPCELMIGTQLNDSRFAAHAWVELHGYPVNDRENVKFEFTAFDMTRDRSKP